MPGFQNDPVDSRRTLAARLRCKLSKAGSSRWRWWWDPYPHTCVLVPGKKVCIFFFFFAARYFRRHNSTVRTSERRVTTLDKALKARKVWASFLPVSLKLASYELCNTLVFVCNQSSKEGAFENNVIVPFPLETLRAVNARSSKKKKKRYVKLYLNIFFFHCISPNVCI